jgi:hypothetical protein
MPDTATRSVNGSIKPAQETHPALQILLSACQTDEQRSAMMHAFYSQMEGDPSSTSVQNAILTAGLICAGQKKESPQGSITTQQYSSLGKLIESLPAKLVSKQDIEQLIKSAAQGTENRELTAFLDEWRVNKATERKRRLLDDILHWTAVVTALVVLMATTSIGTYLVTCRHIEAEADARIDRVIAAQPSATHVPLWLSSHQAAMTIGPLQAANGHNETRGIIIRPGDLKLSNSWVSTDGATVIPIQ